MNYPKVTVVGAGQVGATTAFLLATRQVANVVLVDVAEGLPQGKALDMMHSRSVLQFGPRVSGTNDYADTAGSDVVVVTAGLPRKPGMTRDDLLAANAGIVRSVIPQVVTASPKAIVICVTNPLDIMTYLALKESGLPKERIFGMGGVLDSARFAYFIADALKVPIDSVEALACGAHGDAMVPLPRHSMVAGTALTELLPEGEVAALVERTIYGGAEVVAFLKTGSAFYAPAASVARMVEAVVTNAGTTMPSCVYLDGEYGVSDLYMSVPATLGRAGVIAVPELALNDQDLARMQASAATITESLDSMGLRG